LPRDDVILKSYKSSAATSLIGFNKCP